MVPFSRRFIRAVHLDSASVRVGERVTIKVVVSRVFVHARISRVADGIGLTEKAGVHGMHIMMWGHVRTAGIPLDGTSTREEGGHDIVIITMRSTSVARAYIHTAAVLTAPHEESAPKKKKETLGRGVLSYYIYYYHCCGCSHLLMGAKMSTDELLLLLPDNVSNANF
ncbi:hypothetical protein CPC08DRAFT_747825 [Agrocybe pediades]|nr:hypothetical protein CPC08DRAFT_747825 [Agrocybe pediades]